MSGLRKNEKSLKHYHIKPPEEKKTTQKKGSRSVVRESLVLNKSPRSHERGYNKNRSTSRFSGEHDAI